MSRNRWMRLIASSAGLGLLLGLAPAVAEADNYDGQFDYPQGASCVITTETNPEGVIDDAPPPPICFDPAGTAEDEVVAPVGNPPYSPRYYYNVGPQSDYVFLFDNEPYMTHGETIVVTVWDNAPSGGQLPDVSKTQFVLSFPNTAEVTPADNIYTVTVGETCLQDRGGTNYRRVTTSVEQVADNGKTYTQYAKPQASESMGGAATEGDQATRIMDGTRVDGLAVMTTAGDREGLRSSLTWELKFKVRDVPGGPLYTAHTENVVVPPCPGDPVVEPPSPPKFKKPNARIFRTGAHKVRVQMNKGSLAKGIFRVKVNPPGKGQRNAKTKPYTFVKQKQITRRGGLRYGTVVLVKAKYKGGWHKVARTTIRRVGS